MSIGSVTESKGRWRVRVTINKNRKTLGHYSSKEEAQAALARYVSDGMPEDTTPYKSPSDTKIPQSLNLKICELYLNDKLSAKDIAKVFGFSEAGITNRLRVLGVYRKRGMARQQTLEDFIKKAEKVHGKRYDYSCVVLLKSSIPVDITCKLHGVFKQIPNNHLRGAGCPKCNKSSGFTTSKRGYVYLLGMDGHIKVGITNRTPYMRAQDLEKIYCTKFEILDYIRLCGKSCLEMEKQALNWLSSHYENIKSKKNGSTEIFQCTDKEKVLEMFSKLKINYKDK